MAIRRLCALIWHHAAEDVAAARRSLEAAARVWIFGDAGLRPRSGAAMARLNRAAERCADAMLDYAAASVAVSSTGDAGTMQVPEWMPPLEREVRCGSPLAMLRDRLLDRIADELLTTHSNARASRG